MVVGTTHVDYNKINAYVGHPKEFCDWVDSLVPNWAKHIPGIVDNQRYYIAMHVRNTISIPYKKRMELITPLIENIKLKGTVSTFVSIHDILDCCDKNLVLKAICEEDNSYGC